MKRNLPALPPSATDLPTSLLGLASAFFAIGALRYFMPALDPIFAAVLVMLAAAAPPVTADLFYFRRYREKEARFGKKNPVNWRGLIRKSFGLFVTLVIFAALYFVLPEYHRGFYHNYWQLMGMALPLIVLLTPFYFYACMRYDTVGPDAYDEMALLALGNVKGRNWPEIGRHMRNWLVKVFFLPLMLSYVVGDIQGLLSYEVDLTTFASFYVMAHSIIMFTDLLFASIGYVLTMRILNAQIRSSDPTFRGWAVALLCYMPFWEALFYTHYFDYASGISWMSWLQGHIVIFAAWGSSILALLFIYALATVCLGIRFSNLTYRGLITSGPYRFTKHPAYVSKNLSWWLVGIPFINAGTWVDTITDCTLLFGINIIYYMRARTEELHLSNYPEYVEYALAMNERSIFKPLVKILPFMKYKVPQRIPPI